MKPLLAFFLLLFFQNLFAQSGCADTSYRKLYYSSADTIRSSEQLACADGGTLLAGTLTPNGSVEQGLAVKLDDVGNVLWKKKYKAQDATKRLIIIKATELQSGGFLLGGRLALLGEDQNSPRNFLLIKTDPAGNVLWQHVYELNVLPDSAQLILNGITEATNGNILVSCSLLAAQDRVCVTRIDSSGNIVWSRAVGGENALSTVTINSFLQGNDVITWAFVLDDSLDSTDVQSIVGMRFNYINGSFITFVQHRFAISLTGQTAYVIGYHIFRAKKINGHYTLFGRTAESSALQRDFVVLNFDTSLNYTGGKSVYNADRLRGNRNINVDDQGNIHFINQQIGLFVKGFFYSTITSQGQVRRQRKVSFGAQKYNGIFLQGGQAIAFKSKNRTDLALSYFDTTRTKSVVEILRFQNEDETVENCTGIDTAYFSSSQPFALTNTGPANGFQEKINGVVIKTDFGITVSDAVIQTESLCTQISRCDSLRIAGPDTVCANTFVNFTGLKNPDCRKRVLWEMNAELIDSSYQPNDSTLNIRFKSLQSTTPQTLTLYASAANCTIAKDTAQVVLLPALKPLPPDTVVCGAVNIRLTPGKWGKAYLWQNGSTDSVFIATDTGRYTVQVQTFCGTVFSDTFNITRPTVSLGADKTLCKGDSVMLQATQGFEAYQWRSGSVLLSTNGASLTVSPNSTAQYIVAAQTAGGCTVSDTVIVNVLQAQPINLGGDTSFCTGDSLRLGAPLSFSSYQWSNGSPSSFITIKSSGTYWVKATDGNGCSASDSITILPLYPAPVVNIVPKNVVCIGQNDTLRTGSFASYRWSDGSNKTYLPISDTGKYWLRVVDGNGCTGNDTAFITKLALPPTAFLPKDTIVCTGDAVELKPLKSFRNYGWSNGSSTPSITVNNAGLYSLRIADGYGCTGADSIRLSLKDCPNKIFFPSAFTPNGDGKNDLLKPFVEGRTADYTFTVYNRWGQVVFATNDYRKGWDGRLGDAPQTTGAFVWLCHYQFAGEEKKTAKGTVMLIR